jgi:hypothetical protein
MCTAADIKGESGTALGVRKNLGKGFGCVAKLADRRRQLRVIFFRRDATLPTSGLPSKAESLALTVQFDGFDSRADRMPATEGVGQELAFSWWRAHRKRYLLGGFGDIASIASAISPARSGSNGALVISCRKKTAPPASDQPCNRIAPIGMRAGMAASSWLRARCQRLTTYSRRPSRPYCRFEFSAPYLVAGLA